MSLYALRAIEAGSMGNGIVGGNVLVIPHSFFFTLSWHILLARLALVTFRLVTFETRASLSYVSTRSGNVLISIDVTHRTFWKKAHVNVLTAVRLLGIYHCTLLLAFSYAFPHCQSPAPIYIFDYFHAPRPMYVRV